MSDLAFQDLLKYKKELGKFPQHIYLRSEFVSCITDLGADYYEGVINAILAIESDDLVNTDGMRLCESFKYEPLKDLLKKHIPEFDSESLMMNLGGESKLEALYLDRIEVEDSNGVVEITDSKFGDSLRELISKRRDKERFTGFWLLFGKGNGINEYLTVIKGRDHSQNNDQNIYDELAGMYGYPFIESLKSSNKQG